ncbi:bifunctional indole-3-glycerol-phosphate synthase TrpC/phosphoribosylanthranilate isomerase TrpF [Sphingomicrobium clamense]|uniref:N-(5'-phosphoribosyl)anthranilate isomerase n=1 Tax=Sphingomicrobium clamense TaxID=2851013 RepID=A0ABS6V345_9SPHN|nr:bifunctional indole-3-glycerol-phosphate synthase TrpC/phosphoribosylanthranilate isomerase TrpF [Sphingomicrobium sp. B8]
MADVLARIVARKREEVAARLSGPVTAEPTTRSLKAALAKPGARFIMEIKPRSPSGHVANHEPMDALDAYRPVADAISVLTDEEDFGGSLKLLEEIRRNFGGPILAKDFIVDVAQVSEARRAGADAVLVMMSVLDDATAADVMAETKRLSMDAIVEVHDEAEMARATVLGAEIIGINNRDLKTLKTDLAVTERLAPLAPEGAILISESGVSSRVDVQRLGAVVDAFLVGSSLMAAEDIALAARSLVHGPVKLCGLTSVEDVAMAARFGATHAGIILVPETPRVVDVAEARVLSRAARSFGMKPVGVLRNEEPERVAELARVLKLAAVQLHGGEGATDIALLRTLLPEGCEVWTACAVEEERASAPRHGDRTLFDRPGGGTGRVFDWAAIDGRSDLSGAFLAGGITPANANEASQVGAFGIDVGSGVEAEPRRKDAAKIEALFAALRPKCRRTAA